LGSVFGAACKQVKKSAERKQVLVDAVYECEVIAMLDRALLTRMLARLLERVISEAEPGAEIAVGWALEDAEISISVWVEGCCPRSLQLVSSTSCSYQPRSARDADDSLLEFCHLVAEAHGGSLSIGKTLYCVALPWVGPPTR